MANTIPFSITPDAEDFLRGRFSEMPRGAEPMLLMTTSQTDGLHLPRWSYQGESFIVGYFHYAEKQKRELSEFELFCRPISITPDALKQLSGRTLSLRRVDAQYGLMNDMRYVLVADSTTEQPGSALGRDNFDERIKRGLSLAALTVLGGFTGMGVFWIIYGIIAGIILRVLVDKFFGSNVIFPIFATGWILGAIISFFFFRFAFKANGRTRFKQEQIQKKYFGPGRAGWDLNWWVFLGIPASLMAVLLLALAPFAHTDEQKSYGAIILAMIVLGTCLYLSDKMPHRLVLWLGLLGWVLTFIVGYLFFKIHGHSRYLISEHIDQSPAGWLPPRSGSPWPWDEESPAS